MPIPGTCIGKRHLRNLASLQASNVNAGFGLDTGVQSICTEKGSAMVRITKTEDRSRTTVTVNGQLSGDSVVLVETCCKEAESGRKPVQLFLRDITAMDQAGQTLLSRLAAKGLRLVASGVYTSYLVQSLTSDETRHENVRIDKPRRRC